jgi:hypothetical protein
MSIFVHYLAIFGTLHISQKGYVLEIQGIQAVLWRMLHPMVQNLLGCPQRIHWRVEL